MNRAYKSVWNEALGAWVAASEITRARGKRSSGVVLAGVAIVMGGFSATAANATDYNFGTGCIFSGGGGGGAVTIKPDLTGGFTLDQCAQSLGQAAKAGHYFSVNSTAKDALSNYANDMGLGDQSIAIGPYASTASIAAGAVALGDHASATLAGSVALGSNSLANIAAGVAGYDPSTGAPSTSILPAWKSTAGAVSVGNNTLGKEVTRQITNVAAGSLDTDAVNLAQLKQVATVAGGGWDIGGAAGGVFGGAVAKVGVASRMIA